MQMIKYPRLLLLPLMLVLAMFTFAAPLRQPTAGSPLASTRAIASMRTLSSRITGSTR